MIPLLLHQGSRRGKVTLIAPREIDHVIRRFFGVGDHGEQMPAIQSGIGVISHPGISGQEERVGKIHPAVVVANHRLSFPVDGLIGTVIEELVKFGIEDELADQPTTIRSEGLLVGVLSRE